ncbi:MAG TPA: tetratricopeptide repeat protein [Sphingomicrobium sp.]|nr:tetratricopeptide repeat protein [Sphingomicrobium sp.]
MAQPPDISETFLREVDENLRRDQLHDFFKAYGNWLIVAVILFLGASGGFIWWQQHQVKRSGVQVEKLAQIYKDIGSGSVSQAPQQLDELSQSSSKAVRASALFARAALALQQGDTKLATSTYKSIAGDTGLPGPYRDAAVIRQTALEFDQLQPQDIIARLAPLAKPGEPWFGTAGEMTALAMLKQGNKAQAGQLFAAIARDGTVPEAIRARAVQVASSLGVDAGAAIVTQAQ